MAATIEIQVKADIQQAAIGLRALLADLTKTGTISTSTASVVQSSLNKMTGALDGFSGNDFSASFVTSAGNITSAAETIQSAAIGLNATLDSIGANVNLRDLQSAFQVTDKSAEQLVAEIVALRGAIAQTLDPKIIERFGNQINILQSQLGDVTIKSAIKIEKVDTQNLNVPLVPVDVSQIKLLRAQIDGAGPSIEKLNAQIDQVGAALNTATNPKDVVLLRQNFEELKASLATVQTNALQTAFIDAIKPAQQLENEISALKEGVRTSLNPDDIVKFSGRIDVLSAQLANIKFGGLDLSTVSAPLNLLQSAFVDSVKTVQQLENELEALDRTLIEATDPTSVQILGAQVIKLRQQLASVKTSGVEGAFNKIGASSVSAAGKLKQLPKATDSASFALLNLGRVAQDAPFGIMGIANNLNPLLESFQRVQKEAGGTKNALKAVVGSLAGGGGLGFALSIASSLAIVFGDKLFGASKQAEQSKKKFDEVKQSLQEVAAGFAADGVSKIEIYRNALLNLTTPLEDRNKVLDKYNKLVDKQNELSTTDLSNINKINSAVNAQIKIFEQRALVKAAEQNITDFYKVVFQNQFNLQKKISESGKGTANEIVSQLNQAQRNAIPVKSTGITNLTDAQKAAIPVIGKFDKNILNSTKGLESFNTAADISGFTVGDQQNAFDKVGLSANGFINNIKNAKLQIADLFQFINGIQKEGGISVLDNFDAKDKKVNDSTKFNFFEKFFDLKPPVGQVQKQLDEMFQAAHDYAQKNVDLFKVKVGDKFIDLSELQKVGDRKEVVELGKKVWTSIQQGLVKFKPPKIDLATEVNLVPDVQDTNFTGAIDAFVASMQRIIQGKQEITQFLDIPDRSQVLDTYITKFKQIGAALPALIQIEDVMGNLQNVDPGTAKNSPITFNYEEFIKAIKRAFENAKSEVQIQKEQFQKTIENIGSSSFAAIGDALGSIVSGSGIGEAFAGLFQFIGGAIQDLGKQLITMSALFAALKKAIASISPVGSLIAGIGLVALGGVIKNIRPKGFASGGLVFGPTMGLVGEGSGTSRSNPEVIAPLDKLKGFLGNNSGAPSERLVAQVSGANIDLVLQRFYGKQRRNG
jgi:hypothetical protein